MSNNFFKQAGDLDGSDSYLRPAGDLNEPRKGEQLDFHLRPFRNMAPDLDNFFQPAGDLDDDKKIHNLDKEAIENYLLTVVSGKKYPPESELGTICESGRIIVSFSELQQMVHEGYNIISAKCLNKDMIDIDFQKFRRSDSRGRGRF